MDLMEDIRGVVIRGHRDQLSHYPPELAGKSGLVELVESVLAEKLDGSTILKEGLIGGMVAFDVGGVAQGAAVG